ncbi:MAG: cytochrome c oxidase assembly protein, partial [Actinomycetota bacterium]
HWLEHTTLVGTAAVFWWVALQPGVDRRLVRGGDLVYLLAAWIPSGELGALFTFAATPVYADYVVQAARFGFDPLKDQQVAGVLMWVPAGLAYLGGACAVFVTWLRTVEAADRRSGSATVPHAGPPVADAAPPVPDAAEPVVDAVRLG